VRFCENFFVLLKPFEEANEIFPILDDSVDDKDRISGEEDDYMNLKNSKEIQL
jgi:hypothetical protein